MGSIHGAVSEIWIGLGRMGSLEIIVSEADTSHSKEAGLAIYLAFLAKVAYLYYMILTAFKKYWPDTAAKFTSGTQDRFI